MLLKELGIKNFQSHTDTKLDFCPGVNVVVGPNQAGKTAIVRALRWLVFNRPLGFSFCNKTSAEQVVKVGAEFYGEREAVEHEKTPRKATYRVGREEFEAFGSEVPDRVKELVKMDNLNFHCQLEGPFLIGQKPAEIAAVVNKATGLDRVGEWAKEFNSRIYRLSKKEAELREQQEELERGMEELIIVNELRRRLNRVEKLNNEIEVVKAKWQRLQEVLEELGRIDPVLERMRESVEGVEESVEQLRKLVEEVEGLKKVVGMLGEVVKIGRVCEVMEEVALLWEKVEELKDLQETKVALERVVGEYYSVEEEVNEEILPKLTDVKNKYLEELRQMGRCPLCYNKIEDFSRIREVLGSE